MSQATPAGSAAPAAARPHKRTILVVDDVEINRDLVEAQLQSEYDILKAANGREALDLLTEHYSDISLMLLDLVMPTMTGEELLQRVQAVVHQYATRVCGVLCLVYHGIGTALLQCGGGELVAVKRCALQGEEYASFRAVAAVGGDYGVLLENLV